MSVLLLNATFEPLRIISLKRAVCLIVEDKAEIIEESDRGPIRSATTSMVRPSVIRLRYFVKIPYRSRVPLNRRTLMARDRGVCQYNDCTRAGTTIDHITPRSRGGLHEWENVVACCGKCNQVKDDMTVDELGWTLKSAPTTPFGTKWLVLGLASRSQAEEWTRYIQYAS